MRSSEFLEPMPPVCKWVKIMFEAYLTIANRSGSASPAEIANRRKIIHNFIRARITDAATVDDLTQEALVKAERAAPSLKDSSKVEGWMFRIARNVIADHFRNSEKSAFNAVESASTAGPDNAVSILEPGRERDVRARPTGALHSVVSRRFRIPKEVRDHIPG